MSQLAKMEVFVTVAKAGSFAGAAKSLNLTPSAVSKAISRLEQHLRCQLFRRTTRALALTHDGQALFERAVRAVDDLHDAEAFIREGQRVPHGQLRVSMPVVFGATHVAPLIPEFTRQYPDVQIETHSTDGFSSLVDDGFDILIRTGHLQDSNLIARTLLNTRFMTCASPHYVQEHGAPEHPDELLQHDCCRYVFPSTGRIFKWPFMVDGRARQQEVQGRLLFSNAAAMIQAATSGGGLVHLQDYMLAPFVHSGKLVEVLRDFSHDGGPVSAVYPRHKHLSANVRVFVDFLRERIYQG